MKDNIKDPQAFLTNEKVSTKFKSQFELVNYAIRLAANAIKTGRDPRVRTESQNRALQALAEIVADVDYIDDIPEEKPAPVHVSKLHDVPKHHDRDKDRDKDKDQDDILSDARKAKKNRREYTH